MAKCPLLALSGHSNRDPECPLSGVNQNIPQRFMSNTLAILDAIRRDIALTRLVTSCFCASQICAIASIQGVATSSDLSFFAFPVYPCAFELALLLLGQCA
jgi:hypothetical protein